MTGFLEATASCQQKGKYRYAGNKVGKVPKGRQSGASLLCLQHYSGKQKEQALRIQRVEHLFWAPEESPPISFPLIVTSGPGASQGPAVPGS